MYKMLFCKKKEEKVLNYKPIFSVLRMYFYQWYLIWSDGCLLHLKFWCLLLTFWLKQLCSLKPVSILRAKEGSHKMQNYIFRLFGLFFSKVSFLRLQNFISTSIKYPIKLIFSVVVCIHVNSYKIYESFHPYLIDFFEVFISVRYHRDVKALKILASNSKHFRIYGFFKKWQFGVPQLTFC